MSQPSTSQPRPRASRRLVLALAALVVWSLLADFNWAYPNGDPIPAFERAAALIPDASLGFATSRRGAAALYRFDCMRYAAAPRRVSRERVQPRSEWIVSDGAGVLPGYRAVRRFDAGLQLLRRR